MIPIGLIPIFGILLVMIPVTGLTVGWLVKTLAKARAESLPSPQIEKLSAQVAALQEEVESLSQEMKRLEAAQAFDRELLGRRS